MAAKVSSSRQRPWQRAASSGSQQQVVPSLSELSARRYYERRADVTGGTSDADFEVAASDCPIVSFNIEMGKAASVEFKRHCAFFAWGECNLCECPNLDEARAQAQRAIDQIVLPGFAQLGAQVAG